MSDLALPPSPEQKFGEDFMGEDANGDEGGAGRGGTRARQGSGKFVSAFASISRCGVVSKLMMLLHHDLTVKQQVLQTEEARIPNAKAALVSAREALAEAEEEVL